MSDSAFNADEVRSWLQTVRSDLAAIEERLQPLLQEQARLEDREALLHNLLESFGAGEPSANGAVAQSSGSIGDYVVARAVEILTDAGSPMHINDLHAAFRERGLRIPGAGTPANLIVHLRKSPEISSPQRGIYGLTALIGPSKQTKRKTTRRSSRRRRKG
jgi:hypothetical protein